MTLLHAILCTAALALSPAAADSDVQLHALWSDNAVIQQGQPIRLKGTAVPGAVLRAELLDSSGVGVAGEDGRWEIEFPPREALAEPFTIQVRQDGEVVAECHNVVVGEVWVASGQSNMHFELRNTTDGAEAIAAANDPLLRLFKMQTSAAGAPLMDLDSEWMTCTSATVADFSGVAYVFARELRASLGVPVGVIQSSFGGTPAEAWISQETHGSAPELDYSRERLAGLLDEHPDLMANFQEDHERVWREFEEGREAFRAGRRSDAGRPSQPGFEPGGKHVPTVLYNAMIHPLTRYPVRGVIWYQGESNSGPWRDRYGDTMTALISDWRARWNQPGMAFYLVQLPNFRALQSGPGEDSRWAVIREAQRMTAEKLDGVAAVITIDVGDPDRLHPQLKAPIGERLARRARHDVYGQGEVVPGGPWFQAAAVHDARVEIHFTDVGEGLRIRPDDKDLKGFEVRSGRGYFEFVPARITAANIVTLELPAGFNSGEVRYAWADNPLGNLVNSEGLPAGPFRVTVSR